MPHNLVLTTSHPEKHHHNPYPRTHAQASARFHHHWQAREYATAADYAALAQQLALDAGDLALAGRYASARQLAHKYQALKVEMNKIAWHVAKDPILEPDDPPSSEARCNMVCTPDRPLHIHPQPHSIDSSNANSQLTPTPEHNTLVNPSQPVLRYDQPRPLTREMDIDGTFCCLPIKWAPWRRKP